MVVRSCAGVSRVLSMSWPPRELPALRQPRDAQAGRAYHARHRGNQRQTLFHNEEDFLALERVVADGLAECPVECFEVARQTPPTAETITDLGGYASAVQISASAGYPFVPLGLAPSIDFDVKFEVSQMDDCSIVVTVSGAHDAFPAYEIMVQGEVVYSYLTPGEGGPNPGNLNTTLTIPARSVRLPAPRGS